MNVHSKSLPQVAQVLDHTCGAACFDSMYQLIFGQSLGEEFFAEKLGIDTIGYAPVERVVALAREYQLNAELRQDCTVDDMIAVSQQNTVVFVTWWFDDAGHYSLIRSLENDVLTLMDPWQARDSLDTHMTLEEFVPLWNLRGAKLIVISL